MVRRGAAPLRGPPPRPVAVRLALRPNRVWKELPGSGISRNLSCKYTVLDDGRIKIELGRGVLIRQFDSGKLKLQVGGAGSVDNYDKQ